MFTDTDKQQIEKRGMTVAQVEHQLEQIKNGFPYLRLIYGGSWPRDLCTQ